MKRTVRSQMDDQKARLTQKQAAKGFYAPADYVPLNREQRRDLERARKRGKK